LRDPEGNADRRGDLGMLCFNLGRDADAEEHCQQLIRDFPEKAIGYGALADGLLRDSVHVVQDRAKVERAIHILQQAIAYPVEDANDFDVPLRLTKARKLLGTGSIG
jgi:hypothetical protein